MEGESEHEETAAEYEGTVVEDEETGGEEMERREGSRASSRAGSRSELDQVSSCTARQEAQRIV